MSGLAYERRSDIGEVVGAGFMVTLGQGQERPYINLDNAASTPALRTVMDEVLAFMPLYSSVHRGTGLKSRVSTERYERARETASKFVGADPREHVVIFGRNTTEAINILAGRLGLQRRDVVIVSGLEHHSNDLPWRTRATVRRIRLTPAGRIDLVHLEELLERYAGRVRLVAVTGASNVTGYMPDLTTIARLAHAARAEVAVDAAQLAPHRRIVMGQLDDPAHLDYVALSGHKMYAPFGIGVLVGRRATFEHGAPVYRGGGTVSFVGERVVDWAPPPDRDEAGSPNVVGAVALAAAMQALEQIGFERISQHESDLVAHALSQLKTVQGLTLYGDDDPARAGSRTGVVSLALKGVPHALVAAILGYEYGIGVRNGCFCAHPYVTHLLQLSSHELGNLRKQLTAGSKAAAPGLVRVSFGLYNTKSEIDELARALHNISAGKYWEYVENKVTGEYTPKRLRPTWTV